MTGIRVRLVGHCLLAAVWLGGGGTDPARAGGGPENVAVVVNADSWASLAVANEYVALRRIPSCNVVYLRGLCGMERISVEAFRKRILRPLLETLQSRGLVDQIDYVVYSSDFPTAVDARREVAKRQWPKVLTPIASITGLTYLHEYVQAKDPAYLGLNANRYFRRPGPPPLKTPITAAEAKRFTEALSLSARNKWAECTAILSNLTAAHPDAAGLHYRLARSLAHQNKLDRAWAALERAVATGWWNAGLAEEDPALKPLRQKLRFAELLDAMRRNPIFLPPALGFRHSYAWDADGRPVRANGPHYLLSTMLAATSGRGTSVSEAIAALRRSADADGTRPRGTIYFMADRDVRSRTRQWAFREAVKKLNRLGVTAEILPGKVPGHRPNVQGVMMGTARFNWAQSGSVILPGAICEHLTSFGGVLSQSSGHTPLTEFIRFGAAGSSGTVAEPFAIQAKFPNAFMHLYYARGCTLAEAFYQSVSGPYQLLIVGDPLCRPWAVIPAVRIEGVVPGQTVKGAVSIRPTVEPGPKIRHYEFFVDGVRTATCPPGGSVRLDTTTMPDGYHELRVVAVAADPIATQGRAILPVTASNRGRKLHLKIPPITSIRWDRSLVVDASLAGAREIGLYHNGRLLNRIEGAGGRLEVKATELGLGRVCLQAVGKIGPGPGDTVRSDPVEFDVICPPPLPPLTSLSTDRLAKGLLLTSQGAGPVVVADTGKKNWLTKAGVTPGASFELSGYFRVEADDVFQYQVRSNAEVVVEVDGHEIGRAPGGRWRFLPVALAAGWHELRVRGRATNAAGMNLRFGGAGTYRLSRGRFRCEAPAGRGPG